MSLFQLKVSLFGLSIVCDLFIHPVSCLLNDNFVLIRISELFIMIPVTGAARKNTIFLEEKLGLTNWRQSYRLTGTHPSPRSVSVWRQAGWLSVLNYRWWAIPKHVTGTWHMEVLDWSKRPPRRFTVTERGSIFTHWQLIGSLRLPKQGSVLSPTMQITALMLIPELDLVQEDHMMSTTRVESLQMKAVLIMDRSSLKPWGTSWCSDERKLYI